MLHVYEVEILRIGSKRFVNVFDLGLMTSAGQSDAAAYAKAAEVIQAEIKRRLARDQPLPKPTWGHASKSHGRIAVVAVEVARAETHISAADAAVRLGVSRATVTRMLARGTLLGWREGRNTYVTEESVAKLQLLQQACAA